MKENTYVYKPQFHHSILLYCYIFDLPNRPNESRLHKKIQRYEGTETGLHV
jgi:hypothetical protein